MRTSDKRKHLPKRFADTDHTNELHDLIVQQIEARELAIEVVHKALLPRLLKDAEKAREKAKSQADKFIKLSKVNSEHYPLPRWFNPAELRDDPIGIGLQISSSMWEKPVMNKDYAIGFIDLSVEVEALIDYGLGFGVDWSGNLFKEESLEWCQIATVNFEAKTYIRSCGELIRQIRLYQQYAEADLFVVVSPDTRHAETLSEQGIYFLKYPPEDEEPQSPEEIEEGLEELTEEAIEEEVEADSFYCRECSQSCDQDCQCLCHERKPE